MNSEQFKELNERKPNAVKVKLKASSNHTGYPAQGFDAQLEVQDMDGNKLNIDAKDLMISVMSGNHAILATFTVYVSDLEVDADVIPGFDV